MAPSPTRSLKEWVFRVKNRSGADYRTPGMRGGRAFRQAYERLREGAEHQASRGVAAAA